ncbi:ParB N-terminal domain-containing protein, partial [Paraburkholderia sp. NMBU_R16]|uniref:ParB N-terminal domain-containing protein n=1 Tax=Paraburkholderia sp. NMBU_R16 TaxID=2698676 RepID=UPI0015672298
LGFLQKPDDLLFRKTLLHVRLLLRKRTLLGSDWPGLLGAGHADCVSNPYNPREFYPEHKIHELALTLKRDGQIEAIKVTKLDSHPGKYVIIDGERLELTRFRGHLSFGTGGACHGKAPQPLRAGIPGADGRVSQSR